MLRRLPTRGSRLTGTARNDLLACTIWVFVIACVAGVSLWVRANVREEITPPTQRETCLTWCARNHSADWQGRAGCYARCQPESTPKPAPFKRESFSEPK